MCNVTDEEEGDQGALEEESRPLGRRHGRHSGKHLGKKRCLCTLVCSPACMLVPSVDFQRSSPLWACLYWLVHCNHHCTLSCPHENHNCNVNETCNELKLCHGFPLPWRKSLVLSRLSPFSSSSGGFPPVQCFFCSWETWSLLPIKCIYLCVSPGLIWNAFVNTSHVSVLSLQAASSEKALCGYGVSRQWGSHVLLCQLPSDHPWR